MNYAPLPPFAATAGPRQGVKIVFCGEAWGREEEPLRLPFVGESGKEFWRMLGEAISDVEPELHAAAADLHKYGSAWVRERERWLAAAGIAFTNVLALRPPDNKLEALCVNKKDADAESKALFGSSYPHPSVSNGKYLRPQFLPELDRLKAELLEWKPNLVVGLGNTAIWALLRVTNIGTIRGTVTQGYQEGPCGGVKVLPTYHPAGVMRNWAWRPIVVADLMKCRRESAFPEIRRPERRILINPTLDEVKEWLKGSEHAAAFDYENGKAHILASDTETEGGQIRCISIGSATECIVIPFWDKTKPGWSYWTEPEEREVWELLDKFFLNPLIEFVFQNLMYDAQYLTPMKISVTQCKHDTMLLHHSIYPELQKGLGFLGSLYCNEPAWKLMNKGKRDSEKRDE